MLNKDVCKNCVNNEAKIKGTDYLAWKKNDDINWDDEDCIECPAEFWEVIELNDLPENCYHKFEHAVSAGLKEGKL